MSDVRLALPIAESGPVDFGENLQQWLVEKASKYNLRWLLAHADDGVSWGRLAEGQLLVASDPAKPYAPALRAATLQQLRLFGPTGELYLWRGADGWYGRLLDGRADATQETFTTQYLLWGDQEEARANGFVWLADGQEGLRHAPPLPPDKAFQAGQHYLALQVRHYVAYDEDGQAYVAASRLVKIDLVERAKERGR